MIPLEQQVVNRELSKKLKELKVPQESLFSYYKFKMSKEAIPFQNPVGEGIEMIILSGGLEWKMAAFTASELASIIQNPKEGTVVPPIPPPEKGRNLAEQWGEWLVFLIEKSNFQLP